MVPAVPVVSFFALGLIGILLIVTIVACVALSRSKVGQWILGAGAALFAIAVTLCGLFFVIAIPMHESATVESYVEHRGSPIPLGSPPMEQIAVAPASVAGATTSGTAENSKSVNGAGAQSTALENPVEQKANSRPGVGRPAWMDSPMGRDGTTYRTIATAGPYSTLSECNQKLPEALQEAVRAYAERLLGVGAGDRVKLSPSFIHERVVRGEWLEQAEFSFGPMYNLHELLEFNPSVAQEIERQYRASQVSGRLAHTGLATALALGLIGVLFSYLKLDTLTRGYYTGRLRVAAGAVILAEAVVAGLLVSGNIGF